VFIAILIDNGFDVHIVGSPERSWYLPNFLHAGCGNKSGQSICLSPLISNQSRNVRNLRTILYTRALGL